MIKNVNLDLVKIAEGHWLRFECSEGKKATVHLEGMFTLSGMMDECVRQWIKDQFNKPLDNLEVKRAEQITMLEKFRDFSETGEWKRGLSYPDCGYDLVKQGLVTQDSGITDAGRAALFLLGKGEDPTDSKAVHKFEVKL